MIADTEYRIIKARNELRALKTATKLAYSNMLMPENVPKQTYSGSISLSTVRDPMARVTATFTRTDGVAITPYVDITLDTNIYTFEDWVLSIGGTISGRDKKWGQSGLFSYSIDSTTDTSVTFVINVSENIMQVSQALSSVNFSVKVTAISPVEGTLTLRRTI